MTTPATLTVTRERDPDVKERICRDVLESLPDWFGIPEAIDQFCREVRALRMWVAKSGAEIAGFATVQQHFPVAAELHLIAIRAEHHREGLGEHFAARDRSASEAQGDPHPHGEDALAQCRRPAYAQTHRFYATQGCRWKCSRPCGTRRIPAS